MNILVDDYAAGIFKSPEPPCLSLYQPTHRHHPDNVQDGIRFRNLVKKLEEQLQQKYRNRDIQPLLAPFQALAGDFLFWDHTLDGLAVFGAPNLFRVYRLQRPVPELAEVADSFHIKPLLRILQSADRYYIAGLNRQELKLFEGNRDALDEVELPPDIPRTVDDVVGENGREPETSAWTYRTGTNPSGVFQGQGGPDASDIVENDTARFFRAVDQAILEHYSRPSESPLLLAALPENQSLFRRVSRNPFLMPAGIDTHPDAIALEELRNRAWQTVEPQYLARLAGLVEQFGAARAQGRGDADLAQVARNAVAGRVGTLLVEAGRHIPGHINPATGEIEFVQAMDPEIDDLLDDLAEVVLQHGGEVVVVPAERMPAQTGVAAIYRY